MISDVTPEEVKAGQAPYNRLFLAHYGVRSSRLKGGDHAYSQSW